MDVFTSPNFGVAPYGRGYADLAARTGRKFAGIEFALEYLPIAHDGERHAFLRDYASKYLQSKNAILRESRQARTLEHAQVFDSPGSYDLVLELISPLVADIIFDLTSVRFEISPSTIMSRALSLRKRQALDAEIARIKAQIEILVPGADRDEIGIRVAFAILGNDATMGMLANNLFDVFNDHPSVPLCDIEWPQQPNLTAITTIDRASKCPFYNGGTDVPADATVRMWIELAMEAGDAMVMFGAGAHVCLGKGFALALWRDLTKALQSKSTAVKSIVKGPQTNRMFELPDSMAIEVI